MALSPSRSDRRTSALASAGFHAAAGASWRAGVLRLCLAGFLALGLAAGAAAQTANPAIVLSPSPVQVDEGDSASYTVKLATQPSDSVTVTINVTGQSGREGNQWRSPPHFNLDKTSLTFNPSGANLWSTAQTVTVSIGEDDQTANWSAHLLHTASGGGYGSVTARQRVLIRDDDAPNQGTITITAVSSEVTEGERAQFIVHLNPAPKSALPNPQVSITWVGNFGITGGISGLSVANRATVLFAVQTEDDNVREADGSVTATPAFQSFPGYRIGSPGSATVVVKDNDGGGPVVPTVSIAGGAAVAEGNDATFTVTATPPPTAALTVKLFVGGKGNFVAAGDLGVKNVRVGTGGSATYKVPTVDDGVNEPNGSVKVSLSSGPGYRIAAAPANEAEVAVSDNDETAAIVLSRETLTVAEGGEAEYTVKLASQPTTNVTVAITGHASTDLTVTPASLTFSPSGSNLWSTAQTVTVEAGEDADAANDAATLTHRASGGDYAAVTAGLGVTTTDDETAEILLSKETLTVDEGDDETYTVKLAS
ncbi:MAG: hypothetical protein OXF47_03720, partial [Nitrospira sp.]|nr:hypothetical protein [Nitrospira sp.]